MNFYFYCPKEDINQRHKWRLDYKKKWLKDFENLFLRTKKNIQVIVGVSPGLDFDFKSYSLGKKKINLLIKKFEVFISYKAQHIAILFDDIPIILS